MMLAIFTSHFPFSPWLTPTLLPYRNYSHQSHTQLLCCWTYWSSLSPILLDRTASFYPHGYSYCSCNTFHFFCLCHYTPSNFLLPHWLFFLNTPQLDPHPSAYTWDFRVPTSAPWPILLDPSSLSDCTSLMTLNTTYVMFPKLKVPTLTCEF